LLFLFSDSCSQNSSSVTTHPISFAAIVQKSRKAKELLKNCLSFSHIAAL
jgi:hypothetical protein